MKYFTKTGITFTKLILFVVFAYFFYLQIKKIDLELFKNIRIKNIHYFIIAILLIPVNYYIEFNKWKLIVDIISFNTSKKVKIYSFMSGILSGFLTPNLMGNFIGRMFYFERKKRISIILLTSVSNLSQFYASIFIGAISIFYLPIPSFLLWIEKKYFILFFFIILIIALIFFFYFEKIYTILKLKKRLLIRFETIMKDTFQIRFKFILLSSLRFLIFSFQYLLFLISLGIDFSFDILFIIWGVYFWSTLIPSLWFGKLFIRESVALWLFSIYSYSSEIILSAALCIWISNQLIPAVVSIPFIKFRKENV